MMLGGRSLVTFQRTVQPPLSGSKSKPNEQEAALCSPKPDESSPCLHTQLNLCNI
jgi:hypothetical protein